MERVKFKHMRRVSVFSITRDFSISHNCFSILIKIFSLTQRNIYFLVHFMFFWILVLQISFLISIFSFILCSFEFCFCKSTFCFVFACILLFISCYLCPRHPEHFMSYFILFFMFHTIFRDDEGAQIYHYHMTFH